MERPEPAFQPPEGSTLHGRREAERLVAHLEMHLVRQPDDLYGHTRRILIAGQLGDAEATYGALVDLFIALADRGVGLKSAMLSQTVLQLDPPQRRFLASHLASGVRADENIHPPANRSVLTHGLVGMTTPAL